MKAPRQVPTLRQVLHDALAAVGRVAQHVKRLPRISLGHEPQHLDGPFRPRSVGTALAGHRLLGAVQPEQERQGEPAVGQQRQTHQEAQDHPTMAPVDQRVPAAGDQGVVMHPDAVDLAAAFAGQRVIEDQKGRALRRRQGPGESQQGQAHRVERPAGRGKDAVKGRVMLAADLPGGHQGAGDRVAAGEEPAGHQKHETGERRVRHGQRNLLHEVLERRYQVHREPPDVKCANHSLHRQAGSFFIARSRRHSLKKCES